MNNISEYCPTCSDKLISMDKYYNLTNCYDFLYVCPKHPAKLHFDLSDGEMINLVANRN